MRRPAGRAHVSIFESESVDGRVRLRAEVGYHPGACVHEVARVGFGASWKVDALNAHRGICMAARREAHGKAKP